MGSHGWTIVLAALAVVFLLGLVVTTTLLMRTRAELNRLRASVREVPRQGAKAATGRMVRAVVQSAARLRDEGLSGMLTGSLDDIMQWARDDRAAIVQVAAPDGTVTFFFSDIENSTALNERLGDARWLRTLKAHNDLVRGRIAARGGHVVKTVGDGFMAVFGDPSTAVHAAVEIHDALARPSDRHLRRTPVAVRIGIHTGPAVSRDGDYFGRNVALAARVAAHAHGGQTLITAAVRTAVAEQPDLRLEPCGPVALKGITAEVELWRVSGGRWQD